MKKTILIISFSHLQKDPRVLRQVQALSSDYNLYTIGLSPVNTTIPNLLHSYNRNNLFFKLLRVVLSITKLFNCYLAIVLKQYQLDKQFKKIHFDLILCNDVDALPLGFAISNKKIPVWADLHEYSPREFENSFLWRLYFQSYKIWLCRKYLPLVNYISVVCNGIAKEYEKNFNITTNSIITNAAFYHADLKPIIPKSPIKIIHHGAAMPNRKIEVMIDMMQYLGNEYELNMMLVVNGESQHDYLDKLRTKALDVGKKIHFLETVSTNQIPMLINSFDIGLYILEPSGFNELYALPNKFFEFIQARLCLAVSPNPEMSSIVNQSKLGIVSKDYTAQSMATAIEQLSLEDIFAYKSNADLYAWEYSADKNIQHMQAIVKSLLDKLIA